MIACAEALKIVCLLAFAFQSTKAFVCPTFWCCNPPNPDPQPKPPSQCGGPIEGVWLQEHLVPRLPCQSTLMLESRTRIWLRKRFDNVYTGEGLGTILIVPFAPPNNSVSFLAVFDPETCTFAGSVYSYEAGLSLPYQWVVFAEEKRMVGSYVNLIAGSPYLSTRSQFNVTYEGPLS